MKGDLFYKKTKWIRKRDRVLRKYSYECQESKRFGKNIKAEMVHHIYPRELYPELSYVDWNLLPLTNAKHNTFHDRENNEIIGQGLYWQRKRKRKFENFYSPPLQENQN